MLDNGAGVWLGIPHELMSTLKSVDISMHHCINMAISSMKDFVCVLLSHCPTELATVDCSDPESTI